MFTALHLLLAAIGGIGLGLLLAGWCGSKEPEASPPFLIGCVVLMFAVTNGLLAAFLPSA